MARIVGEHNVSSGLRLLGENDVKALSFDFADCRAITVSGTSLSSATITPETGYTTYFTVGSVTVSGTKATATFTGVAAGGVGTDGITQLECLGTMADGQAITMVGEVLVFDPLDPTTWAGS